VELNFSAIGGHEAERRCNVLKGAEREKCTLKDTYGNRSPNEENLNALAFADTSRLLKNAHLRRYPHSSSSRRTSMYASLFVISGALHLDVFEQPEQQVFFSNLLECYERQSTANQRIFKKVDISHE
jgi:hypothetical protein